MAHYAKLDENNIVLEVIVIANEDCLDENGVECEENGRRICEALTGHANWKKTSRNTCGGVHYDSDISQPSNDQSKAFRMNFGSPGMKYDPTLDRFIKLFTFLILIMEPILNMIVMPFLLSRL